MNVKTKLPGMSWKKDWQRNKLVYLIFLPVFAYIFVLH